MRWLCDENVPRSLVDALRQRGHDVVWVRETSPGIDDADVLALAIRERRVCLTFDKDFGELWTRTALPSDCGIVLLRVSPPRSTESAAQVVKTMEMRDDWVGHFSVLEPGRIRIRRVTRYQ